MTTDYQLPHDNNIIMEQTECSTSGARDDPGTSIVNDRVPAVTEDDSEIGEKSARFDPFLMRDKSNATTYVYNRILYFPIRTW